MENTAKTYDQASITHEKSRIVDLIKKEIEDTVKKLTITWNTGEEDKDIFMTTRAFKKLLDIVEYRT